MTQLDMFKENSSDYLYGEVEKIRNSMDRRCRAIFALISEMQDQLLKMQENEGKIRKKESR